MLRCGRCGSSKFLFTTHNHHGEHHGAVCAKCGKRLNAHDACGRSAESALNWPASQGDTLSASNHTGKPLRG